MAFHIEYGRAKLGISSEAVHAAHPGLPEGVEPEEWHIDILVLLQDSANLQG